MWESCFEISVFKYCADVKLLLIVSDKFWLEPVLEEMLISLCSLNATSGKCLLSLYPIRNDSRDK